jgi:NADPH:quinone reductase-like Zn-dependent oxidoreductase
MRAARIHSFGSTDALELEDVAPPEPKRDEVLIKVVAASVNPVDYKIASGQYPGLKEEQLPVTLGRDVAGVVVRCGEEVTTCKTGDAVYALLDGGHGGQAEYATVRERDLAKKPSGSTTARRRPCRSRRSRRGRVSSITAGCSRDSTC